MIRRPPRSPLFPYTPLSRSQLRREPQRQFVDQDGFGLREQRSPDHQHLLLSAGQLARRLAAPFGQPRKYSKIGPKRSEEHTSELQSQSNIVCRLLPEKKKKI